MGGHVCMCENKRNVAKLFLFFYPNIYFKLRMANFMFYNCKTKFENNRTFHQIFVELEFMRIDD